MFNIFCGTMVMNPFFESSLDLLCIADFEGYFKDVNPAFIRMIGYTKEELLSKKINEFVYESDRATTQALREGIYENKSIINFENRYCTKSGELVWLSWSAVPLEDEKLVYAIAKDITHDKVLKNERIEELTKLTKRNDELTRLSMITSHDLRSPVNSLLSLFQFIDYDAIDSAETIEVLKYMEVGAKGIKNSLDNSLDLLSSDLSNKDTLREVVLSDCLRKATTSIASLIKNSRTDIKTDFSAFTTVYFDEGYMESIFLNLVTNAIKYAKTNVSPVILCKTSVENDRKTVTITDNGRGFDMDRIGDKVFGLNERFCESEEGKGVGLYLIHNQITSLGGRIRLESKPDHGSSFIITFKP